MTLIGVKKVLNSENSDIDEIYNTTIRHNNFIKTKINNIKNIINELKYQNLLGEYLYPVHHPSVSYKFLGSVDH